MASITGVGETAAAHFLTKLFSPERFARLEEVTSYLSLAPGVGQSGNRPVRTKLCPIGQKRLAGLRLGVKEYDELMQTFVALLRAVNVGGTGKLPMAELRSMAEAAGLAEVRTYIQSGNLVFSSADDPSVVKRALEKRLETYAGKPVGVIVRTAREMQAVLNTNPFSNAEPSKVGVLFLDTSPSSETIEAAKGQTDEEIKLGEREVFVHYPSGMGRTKLRLAAMSEGTVRNINTVTKLVKMATEDSS